MKRTIITTADGSKTIQLEDWNEQYHSIHGAIQESKHVFIKDGLQYFVERFPKKQNISILEIGFGTGLNALLTLLESDKKDYSVNYIGVEAYPVSAEEISQLNYDSVLTEAHSKTWFKDLHECYWEEAHQLTPKFSVTKQKQFFKDISLKNQIDIIYFDAFGARVQPELWTESIFKIMFKALKDDGVLVTYSAKGSVRRAMQAVGFTVERLPGPPGKREMLRALKNSSII